MSDVTVSESNPTAQLPKVKPPQTFLESSTKTESASVVFEGEWHQPPQHTQSYAPATDVYTTVPQMNYATMVYSPYIATMYAPAASTYWPVGAQTYGMDNNRKSPGTCHPHSCKSHKTHLRKSNFLSLPPPPPRCLSKVLLPFIR